MSEKKTKSILLSSQNITLLLHPVISNNKDLVTALLQSYEHVYNFFSKSRWRNN